MGEEAEPRIKILVTLANANDPLRASEIAFRSGISRQLVARWLPIHISTGLILPVQTFKIRKYVIQPALVEFNWTPKKLRDMMEPLIQDTDLSHVEDRDDAILNIAHMALELYGEYREDEDGSKTFS